MSPEFLATTLIVVVTPGPGVLYTLAAGLSQGARASAIAAFACTLGILPHMVAAATGLAALLYTSALAFDAVRFAGVAYLLYMAWTTWREGGGLTVDERTPRTARQIVASGILVNILNPKLTIFFFAFLPQFVPSQGLDALPLMLQRSSVFMVLTLVIFAIYGVMAAAVRRQVLDRPRVVLWMRRTFAAAFVALGLRLATADR